MDKDKRPYERLYKRKMQPEELEEAKGNMVAFFETLIEMDRSLRLKSDVTK